MGPGARGQVVAQDHESQSEMTKSAPALELESVTLRPAANGGVIVTCAKKGRAQSADAPPSYESKDYAFSGVDEALRYAASELGGGQAMARPEDRS